MSDCCCVDTSICPCGGFTHPSVIFNSPGQSVLSYRVGDFTAFRRALLQSLPGETELSSTQGSVTTQIWRPTGHGDLALQMMEWWAYLADILTFYNQRIANQAYLGTADLPQSVNGLVRLLGYRPRPGIGATGTLAALANTPLPFTLPQGFAIQSKPGPGQQPQVFEVSADTTVGVPPTGPVSQEQMLGAVTAQTQTLNQSQQNVALNASTSILTVAGTVSAVKNGAWVLVLPSDWASTSADLASFGLATVTSVSPANDPTLGAITSIGISTWMGSSNLSAATSWRLYYGGQSAQVWQYPAAAGWAVNNSAGTIDLASIVRNMKSGDPVVFQSSATKFGLAAVASTTEVLWYANPPGTDPTVAPGTPASPVIAIPIPHTRVTLTPASSIASNVDVSGCFIWYGWKPVADLLAVPSPTIVAGSTSATLQLPSTVTALPPPSGLNSTIQVLVVDSVGNGDTGVVTPANSSTSALVTLDTPVPLLIPPLQTYFNLLGVSRGKTVPSETLGSGNATLAGQDFTLANAPVTYLQDPASVSGNDYSSTIQLYVNGLQWREVQTFYGQTPDAQVFVTREDDSGNTHVVFGDGVYGSRLPTGTNNVVAGYRYGSGAAAPSAGTLTVVLKPQPGLRSIVNPVAVGGGSDPDPPAKIQQFAPQSVLTFGRAVSADDFRVIAAQAPGVTRAAAAFGFDPVQQRPCVTVWVGDDAAALNSATGAITAAADPNRLPSMQPATQLPITLSLSIAVGSKYQPATVQAAVYAALLDPDTGLLGVNNVGIGQVFFDSQIYAACLAVPGVSAVHNLEFSETEARFRYEILFRRRASALAAQAPCGRNRHDPGAGGYYFLPDDGTSLIINVETS